MPTSISIDASVAVKAIVEEQLSDRARDIFVKCDLILAPAHAYAEIAEILYRKILAGALREEQAAAALAGLPEVLTLVPLDSIVVDALRIAGELRHSVYDCLYLAAARLHNVKLVTADLTLLRKVMGSSYSPIVINLESFSSSP